IGAPSLYPFWTCESHCGLSKTTWRLCQFGGFVKNKNIQRRMAREAETVPGLLIWLLGYLVSGYSFFVLPTSCFRLPSSLFRLPSSLSIHLYATHIGFFHSYIPQF